MVKQGLAGIGMILLLTAPVVAQDQTAAPAAAAPAPAAPAKKAGKKMAGGDEAGIKKSFEEVSQAWNAGDAKGVASLFTEDGSLVNPMGMEGHGKAEVLKVIETEFAGPMKGTQQTFDDFSFTWVMPNLALVDCTGTVTGMKNADGTDAEPMKVHVYGVIVNRGKGWKARAIRAFAFLKPPSAAASASTESSAPAASETPAASTDKSSDSMNK